MEGLILLIIAINLLLYSPALIYFSLAIYNWKRNRERAKVQLIIAFCALIVGLGICASFLS